MSTQEFLDELAAYRQRVDTTVRLKTAPNSVLPIHTGGRLRDVADLFEMLLEVLGDYTPTTEQSYSDEYSDEYA